MLKRTRKTLLNVLIAIGGILVALILLEVGARLLPSPYDDSGNAGLACSDQLGWRGDSQYEVTFATDGHQHVVAHNRAGMHDADHQPAKPEDSFRILMLGDSFVRAAHVNEEETSHQLLEDLLNSQDTAEQFEVISAGVSGWGTGQELSYYRTEGRLYKPDLVLLMVYLGNDVQDNLPGKVLTIHGRNCYAPYFVICSDHFDPTPWLYVPGAEPAMRQCSLGRKTLFNILGKIYQSSQLYTQIEPLLVANQLRVDELPYYHIYLSQENELYDYAWQLTLAIIKQLHREVTDDGAELAVVIITPAEVIDFSQMTAREREVIYQKAPDLRQTQQLDLPNQKLIETLTREGISVLDLLPLSIQHIEETGTALYFPNDKHWNVEGNHLAAESIYNWLHENYQLR